MLFKVNSCIEINEQKFITKYVHLLNQKDYTQIPRELSSNSLHFIYYDSFFTNDNIFFIPQNKYK